MIIIIIKIIFLTVSWSLGWMVIISKGMLLEKLGEWAEKKAENNKIFDIIVCPWCIPNIHGLLFVWPIAFGIGIMPFELNYKYFLIYPFCAAASSFITGIIWTIYLTINAIRENYTLQNKYLNNEEQTHSD